VCGRTERSKYQKRAVVRSEISGGVNRTRTGEYGEEHYRLNWPGGREIREDHPSVKLYGYVLFASGEGVYRVNTLMRDDACAG